MTDTKRKTLSLKQTRVEELGIHRHGEKAIRSALNTTASAKVLGNGAREIDEAQRVKAFLDHTHTVVAKEGYHDLIIPLDARRDPTTPEIHKIILDTWSDKKFIAERVATCKYAVNEDKTSGLRCLVVMMKKWAGE